MKDEDRAEQVCARWQEERPPAKAGREAWEIEPDALGCCVRPGARVRDRRGLTSAGGVQVLSRPARGGDLGGVPLCYAQLSDGFDQRGKAGDKRDLGVGRVIAERGADSSRAVWRRLFPAGVGSGMRP